MKSFYRAQGQIRSVQTLANGTNNCQIIFGKLETTTLEGFDLSRKFYIPVRDLVKLPVKFPTGVSKPFHAGKGNALDFFVPRRRSITENVVKTRKTDEIV